MNLYQENILDHYKHPRNKGKIEGAQITRHEANPLCGDVVDIYLQEDHGTIVRASFEGEGCAIAMAGASMLTEDLVGKKPQEVLSWGPAKMIELMGVDPGATRIKCATLALKAFHIGIAKKLQVESEPQGL